MNRILCAILGASSLLLAGCEKPHFTHPVTISGASVPASVLERGRQAYVLNCYACHGMDGDGKGPASIGTRPPPRDFTQGLFKFGGTLDGKLPADSELKRIVKTGLHGTAMLNWDVPDKELTDILWYIKTLSVRWQKEMPGPPIEISADPWASKPGADAVERGKVVYHTVAQCVNCHPHYVTRAEFADMYKKASGVDWTEFRPDMYGSVAKDSDYKLDGKPVKLLPPDFSAQPLRSVHGGTELTDLYRTIGSGVGGTAMPQWKGALTEDDLWALVHYVKSLVDLRDTPGANDLHDKLATQPAWAPPPPPAPAPAPEAAPAAPAKKG